jgi:RNA polymerase sigma-70 factor (ECF subfamily)
MTDMGPTAPGDPQDPDEATDVKPDAPADSEDDAAGQPEFDGDASTFRGLAVFSPQTSARHDQIIANESGDAVQGAVAEEMPSPQASVEVRPSVFDFDTYYLTHHDRLVTAVRHYCAGDHALAEDVVQMTFLKAYEHREEIAAQDSQYSWLLTVARNAATDVFRREHLRADRELAREQIFANDHDPLEESAWTIFIEQLPPPENKVMQLFAQKIPRGTIAKKLGMSKRTVDNHIKRALNRLRRDLGEED